MWAFAGILVCALLAQQEENALPLVVDEITVTAQKREEDLQDVPIAVTAVSSAEIEDARLHGIQDLAALVPNVSIANTFTVGNSFVTVRGISQVNNSDSPIAVVVDGVYQGSQKQLAQELFDLERIEVLKGPQGALYGRNSLGGVINIITKQPAEPFEGHLAAGAGNGSSMGLTGAAGGRLPGTDLQFRLAASYKDSEGLIENVFLDRKADPYTDRSGRLQLRWVPLEPLQLDLRVAASDTEGGAVLYSIFPTTGFDDDFRFQPDENLLGSSSRSMSDYAFRASWQAGAGILTAIAAVTDLEEAYRGDADFSNPSRDIPFPLGQVAQSQDLDVRLVSQEVRWTSESAAPLRWIAGIYRLSTDRSLITRGFLDTTGTPSGLVPFISFEEDNDNTASAAFGEAVWSSGGRWELAGALRYDRDRRRQRDLRTGLRRSASFSEWQPRVTASLQARENLLAYVSLATGFRSGGFNAPGVYPAVFGKETSESLEVGWKSLIRAGRVRLNGAAYATRVTGAQFFRIDVATAGQVIDNIREASMRGFEVDATTRVTRSWDLDAALGFNDADIEDFDGSDRFVGNQTPHNTLWKAHLGSQYRRPLPRDLLGFARLDAELRGRQYWHPDNLDIQGPVQLLNAQLGLEASSWKLVAWAKNLTDERYYLEYQDAAWAGGLLLGSDLGQLAPPRSYGIEVSHRF